MVKIKAYSFPQEVCISIVSNPNISWWFTKFLGDILVHELSIKAYSILQEVSINCFKSQYMLVFYRMDGRYINSQPKH